MQPFKRRKPVPRNRRPAIKSKRCQYTGIFREIIGTLLAGAIFAVTLLTSAFGMSGGFDHAEAGLILAGMVIDGR